MSDIDMNITENKSEESKGLFASFLEMIESFVLAIAFVVLIFLFVARLSIVSGDSMNKTLINNDYVVVVNLFGTYEPERGDIVVVHGNFEHYDRPLVKRVIATGGETIKINCITREVYVDDVLLNEDYVYYQPGLSFRIPQTEGGRYSAVTGIFTATVPEGYVFVMGDNRLNSADSRMAEIGFVPNEFIIGEAVYRISPFSRMGSI